VLRKTQSLTTDSGDISARPSCLWPVTAQGRDGGAWKHPRRTDKQLCCRDLRTRIAFISVQSFPKGASRHRKSVDLEQNLFRSEVGVIIIRLCRVGADSAVHGRKSVPCGRQEVSRALSWSVQSGRAMSREAGRSSSKETDDFSHPHHASLNLRCSVYDRLTDQVPIQDCPRAPKRSNRSHPE
jgi:hypothetical protein